jgi:hypothetical protein
VTKQTGRVLIVLSLPVIVIAGLHFNMIMLGLSPNREPQTLAVSAGAAVLLALGVGGATRMRNGVIAFLVGAAIIGGLLWRSRSNGARWHRELEAERTLADAAAGVCDGKPNTAAGPPVSIWPVMRAGRDEDSEKKSWYATEWKGLPAPQTPAELQLVACLSTRKSMTASCDYGGGKTRSYTIYKYKVSHTLTVREAKTATELGTKTFEGAAPSDKCDESVTVSSRSSSTHDVTGGSPNEGDEIAFVKTFIERAER